MIIKKITTPDLKEDIALTGFFYPDQFVSEETLSKPSYIKKIMDYFSNIAFQQIHSKKNIIKNYKLRNGEFDFNDYSDSEDIKNINNILGEIEENEFSYLKHYPIINSPLNTLKGELIGRPRKERVKALDSLSSSEILEYRTKILQESVIKKIQSKYEPNENGEFDENYYKELSDKIVNYSTEAEDWGNKALKAFKSYFNYSEKNEDGFMDFLTSGQEFHHFYPDNSEIGFKYKLENPVNVWYIGNANAKYTTDCWCVGTLELMSISSILEEFNLSKKELEELTSKQISFDGQQMYTTQTPSLPNPDLTNFSLLYDMNVLTDATLLNSLSFGTQQYHAVLKSYWKGKKKYFRRTYLDSEGYQRVDNVDENYKLSTEHGDIKIEEYWENQWLKCTRIGPYVYTNIEKLEYSDNPPIIGIVNHTKNTKGKSLLDLMKGYQAMYNVLLNQIWSLLSKDIGKVFLTDIRNIPKSTTNDPIGHMINQARERGLVVVDTSKENTGGDTSFNQFTAVDLSRSDEINTRIVLANAIKDICLEMIGINRQRTGSVLATETATGTNTALSQSYAQTEIWFKNHEDLTQMVLQTALNIMQWVELKKPESLLNTLNSDLDNIFKKINRDQLLRNLFVFVTNSKEDKDLVDTLKQLMQPAMQNGADLLEMAEILSTNSENKLKDTLRKIQKRKDEREKQMMDLEQSKIQQSEEQFRQQQELLIQQHEESLNNENLNKQADRETQIRVAEIKALSFDSNDVDNSKDISTASKIALEESKMNFDKIVKVKELKQKDRELNIREMSENNKLKIAKENKSKYDRKKK